MGSQFIESDDDLALINDFVSVPVPGAQEFRHASFGRHTGFSTRVRIARILNDCRILGNYVRQVAEEQWGWDEEQVVSIFLYSKFILLILYGYFII